MDTPDDLLGGDAKSMKELLINAVTDRMTKDKEHGEFVKDAAGRTRNIVTSNIFSNEHFILATLLDPRIKMVPFQGTEFFE